MTETFNGNLACWKIKRCGEEMRLVSEVVSDVKELSTNHRSATWAFPNHLYILTDTGRIFTCDIEKQTTKPLLLDQRLEQLLQPPLESNTFLKAHFDGLVLIFPTRIAVLQFEGVLPQASIVMEVPLPQYCFNLQDFHSAYRFMGWTPEGNVLQIHVTENSVTTNAVWEVAEKKQYISSVFLQPDETHFATLDNSGAVQIFSVKTKEEAWRHNFHMECSMLLTHPKLPILFLLTFDGRVIMMAFKIKTVPPPPPPDDDEEFSGDDEVDVEELPREPTILVTVNIFGERRVHGNVLDFGECDNMGNLLVLGGSEHGKLFLCDIQANQFKPGGDPRKGRTIAPRQRKSAKYQPSFDLGGTMSASMDDEAVPIVADGPIKIEGDDDGKYFKVCHSAKFEGILLDISFVQKVVICLTSTPSDDPGAINESERIRFSGDQITIMAVDKQAKTIQVTTVVQTRGRCSGICLSDNAKFFYTLIQKKKMLAKFKITDHEVTSRITPVAKTDSTDHQLDLHRIVKAKSKSGHLGLCGRDGILSLHSMNLEVKMSSSIHLFHHDTGGVFRSDISSEGCIVATNQTGSLQVFQPKESSRRPSSQAFPTASSPLLPPRTFLPSKEIVDPFIVSLFVLPALSPKVIFDDISWDDKQEQARVARERKRYESSINEVSAELEAMRSKVVELLAENNRLPESEGIDVHEFELDVQEQQRRVNNGLDKEDDLRLELKAWQLARQKVGQKIRKRVWDDMDVKGRSIKGIREMITVANYPMAPMDFEEQDNLEEVLEERKLSKEVFCVSGDLIGGVPQLPKSETSGVTPRDGGKMSTVSGSVNNGVVKNSKLHQDNDNRLFGSRSYEFVDVASSMLYSQLEVTTRSQARQQIILLQAVVRKLKGYFNEIFYELYTFKEDSMSQINDWRDSLKNVLTELGSFDQDEKATLDNRLEWSPLENPELDLPSSTDPDDIGLEVEDPADGKRRQFRKQRTVQSWEFEVEGEIAQPEFMATKSMVDYAPAEISAVEQYESMLNEQGERKAIRKRQLEVDRVELKRKIREAVELFDAKLLELYKTRLAIEKCILAEELKILLYHRRMSVQDHLDHEEENLLLDIQAKEEWKEVADQDWDLGKRILEGMKSKRDHLFEYDKGFEKNFKKEFPGLGFNQLESLMKCFKRRPKGGHGVEKNVGLYNKKDARQDTMSSASHSTRSGKDLKSKSIAAALERMSNMLRGTMLKKTPAATVAMAMSLEELDRASHCPENVDEDSWKHLCELRRRKIASEETIQALDADLYETDQAVYERQVMANECATALVDAVSYLETWRKDRNYKLNNTEVTLAITQGQLELQPQRLTTSLPGATLITESIITKLNQDIQRLGESKLSAMTESKDFRSGTRLLQWEKEKLTMEYADLQAKWTEIQQTKLSKESRHALQAGEHINRPTLAQEYAILDRAATASEDYLKDRLKQLQQAHADILAAAEEKEIENITLKEEIDVQCRQLDREREFGKQAVMFELEDNQPQRMQRIVRRNKLVHKIKEQQDVLMNMQEQLDTYMYRSFPSLG